MRTCFATMRVCFNSLSSPSHESTGFRFSHKLLDCHIKKEKKKDKKKK